MSFFRRAGALIARFFTSAADPGAAVGEFQLYSKGDGGGVTQLFGQSDDGTVHQITPAAGGGGLQYAFVYQPGGVPHDNVYDDWTVLVSAMSAISGPKLLQFDDQFGTLSVPVGTWDMTSTVWEGVDKGPTLALGSTTVLFDDGAVITRLRTVRGLHLQCLGATAINDLDDGDIFILDDYSVIGGDDFPVISLAGIGLFKTATICVRHGSQVLQQEIAITDLTQTLVIEVDKFSLLESNTISNGFSGTGTLVIHSQGSTLSAPALQSFFAGIVQLRYDISGFNPVADQTPLALDPGMVAYYTLGAASTIVNLPVASWHPGAMIIVKNSSSSPNPIVITPTAPDTIDGAVDYTITVAQGSAIVVSDGVSNWMIVSKT
jgi:hypothetical protein